MTERPETADAGIGNGPSDDDAPRTDTEGGPLLTADVSPPPTLEGTWTVARGAELLSLVRGWCARGGDVRIDCGRLERLDLAAVQVLSSASSAARETGGSLALVGVSDRIAESLRWAGLEKELVSWS